MRSISRVSLALAASAVLVGSLALPASADTTDLTVVVPAGEIGISGPSGGAATLSNLTPGGTANVLIEDVTVIDNQAREGGWIASVSLTDFTGTTATIIPASTATYDTGAAAETGTSVVTSAGLLTGLSTPIAVQTATGVVGNNTAIWDATLTVTAPSDALAASYTATLTHSVV